MRVLEPYLPSLSQLRAGTDDDLLLAVVLLLTSSQIAEWRSQLSDFVQREVQHRVLYGPRGTYDIMALLLVSQCPNDVFPDAFQISALDGSGILAAGASACRTRRMDESSTPNDNATMLWACLCLQSSLNCIMEDVTRKPVAKLKNMEALGSENDLFKTRFRYIEEVRVLCRALADELCVEKTLGTPQDACDKAKTCLQAVNQASSKHRMALRHGHPSQSALLAYLDLEQEIVHYAAISQIINILFRPFVYHVKEPVSSVDFFRSFHAQADYLDAFVSVGTARIVAAKLLIYKYLALVRKYGRKHPLRPDVEPNMRQQTEQLGFLRPRNYFLYAALVAAAKAVAEECSGRWFAGHVPDAGEEMALWHGNLLLLERLQRDIIGLPRGTQLLETIVKALRQTVLTLGAWIEAAERQALRGTFPRLIADTTSGPDAEESSFDDFRFAESFINDILDGDILGSPSDFLHPPFSLREASPLTQSFPL
ncbi:hypothetical protein FA10DRAFT_202278 [Acaromyces ingoldii]|uniref:Uncharacterized protein n=1 Tax=Acaromyces ingoldii TaxID=215250 RepID=A0A316YBI8_9BASI|nr:hypothetical protein FA10DRAFT_202278 [Acaromyces ingoldii]PWN86907.1 hypothetical protein FA10DRAFT_202278 [Acaromyces ingoldii]